VDELKKEEEEAKALRKNLIEQQKQVKELRRMINGIGNMTR
jgi:ribosomal protein S2